MKIKERFFQLAENLIILGPPGAGKGTQAVRIADRLGIQHISTGDLLREAVSEGTELGNKAKDFMNKGLLVPDEVILGMISDRLSGDASGGWILDGFPRTLAQAEALSSLLEEKGVELGRVILIDVDPELLIKRLTGRRVCDSCGAVYNTAELGKDTKKCEKCGGTLITRDDDTEETVRQRLEVYSKQTSPVIDYYDETGLLVSIDGSSSIEDITSEIMEELD
ncbi:MAG: adenylate kinase [Candidatus Krumholzibacteriota bacterium]|nr:adenylate kinase [Candidatus Krumholzibacteriota bacterium]